MRAMRFTAKHAPFNAGEIAGFDREECARLIVLGVAVFVDEKQATPPMDKQAKPEVEKDPDEPTTFPRASKKTPTRRATRRRT